MSGSAEPCNKRARENSDGDRFLELRKWPKRRSARNSFEHDPLENPDSEIRLFRFLESDSQDMIELEISTSAFQDCPKYTAISYVWGDRVNHKSIQINGHLFQMTPNGYYALEQVLTQKGIGALRTVYFWMDSICVDQNNLEEKGKQVQLMGDIYETAEEVLASVGYHASDSEFMLDVFRQTNITQVLDEKRPTESYGTRCNKAWIKLLATLDDIRRTQFRETSLSDFRARFSDSVIAFTDRPLWHRMWIIQEVRLARRCQLLCGNNLIDIAHIAPFSLVFKYTARGHPGEWPSWWNRSKMISVIQSSHHTGETDRSGRMKASLAFESFKNSQCTDFRDRVYSLLRVLEWDESEKERSAIAIAPNYKITKLGLLLQVANQLAVAECPLASACSIMSHLYQTLGPLIARDEIMALLAKDQAIESGYQMHNYESTLHIANSPMLCCRSEVIIPLDDYALALEDAPGGAECFPRITWEGKTEGWTCAEARPGDLFFQVRVPIRGLWHDDPDQPFDLMQMVLRRKSLSRQENFEIIGHAYISRGPGGLWGLPQSMKTTWGDPRPETWGPPRYEIIRTIEIKYTVEVFVALVVLRTEVGAGPSSRLFSAEIADILNLSVAGMEAYEPDYHSLVGGKLAKKPETARSTE